MFGRLAPTKPGNESLLKQAALRQYANDPIQEFFSDYSPREILRFHHRHRIEHEMIGPDSDEEESKAPRRRPLAAGPTPSPQCAERPLEQSAVPSCEADFNDSSLCSRIEAAADWSV